MKCALSKKCGGCQFINDSYQSSLDYKNKRVDSLYPQKIIRHPIQGMSDPYGYRNKIIVAFNKDYTYGLYEEHSHHIIPYQRCLLHDEKADRIIAKIASLLRHYHVPIYDRKRRTGEIRHTLIRNARKTGQYLVTLVSAKEVFKGSRNFSRRLVKAFPEVKSIVLNTNKRDTVVVLGNREQVLYGKGFIVDELSGLTFKISSSSFYQINHAQCEKLYTKALEMMDLKKDDVLLDAYCGIGTIGMLAAEKCQRVIGVELNKKAVSDANMNKQANHIKNITFVNEDATRFMAEKRAHVNKIIMDPPREGSTKAFIQSACALKPEAIGYISCNPETQARDLQEFMKHGYQCRDVYPFDMFPFTKSIETVVLMSRVKN